MVEIGDKYGHRMYKFTNNELQDNYGHKLCSFTNNEIQDIYGHRLYKFTNNEIQDKFGHRLYKFTNNEIQDKFGHRLYKFTNKEIQDKYGHKLYTLTGPVSPIVIAFSLGLLQSTRSVSTVSSKKSSNRSGLFVFIIIALICGGIQLVRSVKEGLGYYDGYITTKQNIAFYKSIKRDIKGNEDSILLRNISAKVLRLKRSKYYSWIECYYLVNNKPIKGFILIPERIDDFTKDNDYYIYSKDNVIWKNYYLHIDRLNKDLYQKYKKIFLDEIKNYKVLSTSNNLEKSTIDADSKYSIFDNSGFFDMYKTNKDIMYYALKTDYQRIKKEYQKQYNLYIKNKIKYY